MWFLNYIINKEIKGDKNIVIDYSYDTKLNNLKTIKRINLREKIKLNENSWVIYYFCNYFERIFITFTIIYKTEPDTYNYIVMDEIIEKDIINEIHT